MIDGQPNYEAPSASVPNNEQPAKLPLIVVVGGFEESLLNTVHLVDALGEAGQRAIAFGPRQQASHDGDPLEHATEGLLANLDQLPADERVYILAHSMGAIAALKATGRDPRIAGLILMEAPIQTRQQPAWKLIAKAALKVSDNQREAASISPEVARWVRRATWTSTLSALSHPIRAFREVRAIGHYDIRPDLDRAIERDIPIFIRSSTHDQLFSIDQANAICLDAYDGRIDYNKLPGALAHHDAFWLRPEHTARLASRLVRQMGTTAIANAL